MNAFGTKPTELSETEQIVQLDIRLADCERKLERATAALTTLANAENWTFVECLHDAMHGLDANYLAWDGEGDPSDIAQRTLDEMGLPK